MKREIVLVTGINGAGKSTLVKEFTAKGYRRFNRDAEGGTMADLHAKAKIWMDNTDDSIVLDNTYPTIQSRQLILGLAFSRNIRVRCVHLTTSLEEAQMNVCLRMIRTYGRVLSPEEMKGHHDPGVFPPAVQYKYRKEFQQPTTDEGFDIVEEVPFVRKWEPRHKKKALILDYDGTLRESTGPKPWPEDVSHVKILPNRKERLQEWKDKGYELFGASNQSQVAKGLSEHVVTACFQETNRLLGEVILFKYCPHKVPPICCYCRKPGCGMGAELIEHRDLNPKECIMVGDKTEDKTFAQRCGFQFVHADSFFGA